MSGDVLGAGLMQSLRERHGEVEFRGIGGDLMALQGLQSIFPMHEISLMGFTEIIPHIPHLLRRISETVKTIRDWQPDAVVTIDSPGFNKRVAKKLGKGKIPLIHYVAPSVWAWRPGRAKTMAKLFDHLLCLFPCEPPYFQAEGLPATFIGHPVTDSDLGDGNGSEFRQKIDLLPDDFMLMILPGSRIGEVRRLLPTFLQAAKILEDKYGPLPIMIPVFSNIDAEKDKDYLNDVKTKTESGKTGDVEPFSPMSRLLWEYQDKVTRFFLYETTPANKKDVFASASVALAASGTVTLELAQARIPTVVAYKVSPLSALIARMLVKLKYFTLTNILLNRPAIPEFFQERATPENLATAIEDLMQNEISRQKQLQAGQDALTMLAAPIGESSSGAAAAIILDILKDAGKQSPKAIAAHS